jgi:hypothetical protein
MQSNLAKNIEKIYTAFNKMDKLPKALIKYGCYVFLALFLIGNVMVLLNNVVLPYDSYLDLVSKSIVKVSFSVAEEVIIGALIMDFLFKR